MLIYIFFFISGKQLNAQGVGNYNDHGNRHLKHRILHKLT